MATQGRPRKPLLFRNQPPCQDDAANVSVVTTPALGLTSEELVSGGGDCCWPSTWIVTSGAVCAVGALPSASWTYPEPVARTSRITSGTNRAKRATKTG